MSDTNFTFWYLEHFNLLHALSEKEKEHLEAHSTQTETTEHQVILLPAQHSRRIFYIKKGKLKISSRDDNGREFIHAILYAGNVFGELEHTDADQPNQQAEAIEATTAYSVEIAQFETILKNNKALNPEITKLIGFRLNRIQTRMEHMWFKSAPQRITTLLCDLAEDYGRKMHRHILLDLRLSHQDIATLAATTPQTVSNTMQRLADASLITHDPNAIEILDLNRLKQNITMPQG